MRVDVIEFSDFMSPDILAPDEAMSRMRRMESLLDMVREMVLHTCSRKSLVVFSNPRRLLIGYACEGCDESWGIPLSIYSSWCDGIRRLMDSPESREALSIMAMTCSSIQQWNEMMEAMGGALVFQITEDGGY